MDCKAEKVLMNDWLIIVALLAAAMLVAACSRSSGDAAGRALPGATQSPVGKMPPLTAEEKEVKAGVDVEVGEEERQEAAKKEPAYQGVE